jgi:3-oxoacyl-[acyl-carrier-protein] synthase III
MPAVPAGFGGARIIGWGAALPERIVTNKDLEAMGLETNDEWIRDRTGIERRHWGGTTQSLSVEAGRKAIEMSGVDPALIEVVVLATTTPDQAVPATASSIQDELGLACGAFDVNAACSGFMYALICGHGMIAAGMRHALVIGTDTLSRITDKTDRNTAILFGDGSGAVVLQATEGPGQLLSWDVDSVGAARHNLYANHGGYLIMDGKDVFRRAVRIMVDSGEKTLKAAGVTADDIALVVPHQANTRIIEAAISRLGIPSERTAIVLQETGNTSSASIPLALVNAMENGRVNDGDLVLMVGFGAGMTAASALLRWNAP